MAAKRKWLSLEEKIQVLEKFVKFNMSQRNLAEQFGVGKTQILTILKDRELISKMWQENTCSPSAKKKLKAEAIEIDATVFEWFFAARQRILRIDSSNELLEAKKVTVWDAILWTISSIESIQPSTVTKCFLKAGFPGDQDPKTFVIENDDELFIEIQELVAKLPCDMSTEGYLCVDHGVSTTNVDIDSILESTMSTKHDELCEDTEEEMELANSTIENINVPKNHQEALEWIEGLKMFTRTVEDTASLLSLQNIKYRSRLTPKKKDPSQLYTIDAFTASSEKAACEVF
ncbi:hypothetical protein J437_LFUL017093 [Ladona fulva]|uniref:Uncharacterized protein n=1 Tax=Ladona fulva TaxID=123851 RepID=A0A8K0KN99_LADFU|nr:hypothetical protein J437_LFUL017093 [Ladona fulva]